MNLLLLTRYGRLGASSRMRSFQYLPWLQAAGISTTVAPFLSDAYVAGLQKAKQERSAWEAVRAYAGRLRALLSSGAYDAVWIEKESLPWLPEWLERLLLPAKVPYVLDYDDAVFHYYDMHGSTVVRKMLGQKHAALMRRAALVVAGNEYLAAYAHHAGARAIQVVPTVVDLQRYAPTAAAGGRPEGLPCAGWIGQRSTASFLVPHAPLFQRLAAEGVGRFAAIGVDTGALRLPMDSIAWSEETEVDAIRSLDVGIMPLADGPFERGKCGYKLIQYMACGLAVVASPVGVNALIVEHGVTGFLANTAAEWEQALRKLLADPDLRIRMGAAGRKKVEAEYSLQVIGPRVAQLLRGVAAGTPMNSGWK